MLKCVGCYCKKTVALNRKNSLLELKKIYLFAHSFIGPVMLIKKYICFSDLIQFVKFIGQYKIATPFRA